MTSIGLRAGNTRMVARVITFHFRARCPTSCFASSPFRTRGVHGKVLQQPAINSPRLCRTPIRIPLPHANRMYEHALGRGSTGFRVPRANSTRLQPCLRAQRTISVCSCFWVVQIGLETASATSAADSGISDDFYNRYCHRFHVCHLDGIVHILCPLKQYYAAVSLLFCPLSNQFLPRSLQYVHREVAV
jgi:hypothetical protein